MKGCRQHNLKGFDVILPKNQFTVITGRSGSGKSSFAFDTLYAEGQRRYLEYLSPHARQLIKQLPKPAIDFIQGLQPTLSVQQGVSTLPSYTTVAAYTDIQDFLSLLYARIGEQHSPVTGKKLECLTRQEVVEKILADYAEGTRLQLLAPIPLESESLEEALQRLQKMGFIRFVIEGVEWLPEASPPESAEQLEVVVDRILLKEGIRERLTESVETAHELSRGILKVIEGRSGPARYYSEIYYCPESGQKFPRLEPADFNPRSPHGACPRCEGKGGEESGSGEWKRCSLCQGLRLKPESLACTLYGMNCAELIQRSCHVLLKELDAWTFTGRAAAIAEELIPEIRTRLGFLQDVGLGYLELDRLGSTLSAGESQRAVLASQLGTGLTGVLYVLDEPTRGLHAQDIAPLIQILQQIKKIGNTLCVVEHNADVIRAADYLVELGPGAGRLGGQLVYAGAYTKLLEDPTSETAAWLRGDTQSQSRKARRKKGSLKLKNVSCHTIEGLTLQVPLGIVTGLCGVSGSGKSTLALDILAQEVESALRNGQPPVESEGFEQIQRLITVEQRPQRASPRSTPATYVGVMTPLRQLFAGTRLSRARGYTARRFSTNVTGGRCEACLGLGAQRIDMQFMPELMVPCEICKGERFNYETLQVTWEGHSIADILRMTAAEAADLFRYHPTIARPLELMARLGLDYLQLGQNFTTLSGGEAQRLKLVSELAKPVLTPTLFILDEPCVGLHVQDIRKLIEILHELVELGHSVLLVEHRLDVLRQCDWLIEMGPGAGPEGGRIVFTGTPAQLMKRTTPTAKALAYSTV